MSTIESSYELKRQTANKKLNLENICPTSANSSSKKLSVLNLVKTYSPMNSRPIKLMCNGLTMTADQSKTVQAYQTNKDCHNSKKCKTNTSTTRCLVPADDRELTSRQLTSSQSLLRDANKPLIMKFKDENYEIGDLIGKGRFGEVYLARDKSTDIVVAMKVINKMTMMKYRANKQLVREIRIHSMLDHPNIIKNYGVMQNSENIYLLMEYAPEGNLYSRLKEVGKFDEPTVSKYISQVLNAFKYLQDRHILHRDLKPENLLLGSDGELKLADFGWAIQLPGTANLRQTFCGTLDYISPEMAQGEYYGVHTDNWSIGILAFELLTGGLPFVRGNLFDVINNTQYGEISYPDSMSEEARDFISRLLTQDPFKRMALADSCRHSFVNKHKQITK